MLEAMVRGEESPEVLSELAKSEQHWWKQHVQQQERNKPICRPSTIESQLEEEKTVRRLR